MSACVCTCVHAQMLRCLCGGERTAVVVGSLLPLCKPWRLKLGSKAEQSHQPFILIPCLMRILRRIIIIFGQSLHRLLCFGRHHWSFAVAFRDVVISQFSVFLLSLCCCLCIQGDSLLSKSWTGQTLMIVSSCWFWKNQLAISAQEELPGNSCLDGLLFSLL